MVGILTLTIMMIMYYQISREIIFLSGECTGMPVRDKEEHCFHDFLKMAVISENGQQINNFRCVFNISFLWAKCFILTRS